jgi:hypothetical protein
MSAIKLSKHNYENNDELREFIDNAPSHTRVILLLPRQDLWQKFSDLVKSEIGAKKKSRVVNYLVHKYLQEEEIKPLTAEDEVLSRNENRSPVNLSVDYDLWQQFIDKIRFQYGKKKIQTEVLDMIIENYLETYDQL